MPAAERKQPQAVSWGSWLEGGVGLLPAAACAPGLGEPSCQARRVLWGRPRSLQLPPRVQDVCHPRGSPLGPMVPRRSLPVNVPSGSLETTWAAPGFSAWASEAHQPQAWSQSPSHPGRVVTACCWLLQLARTWRSGLSNWEPSGPGGDARSLGVGRAPCPAPLPGLCLTGGRAAWHGAACVRSCPAASSLSWSASSSACCPPIRAVCCPGHRTLFWMVRTSG